MMDTITEMKLAEYRLNIRLGYDQPDSAKWKNGDCLKCNSVFSVIKKKDRKFCMKCGWVYEK